LVRRLAATTYTQLLSAAEKTPENLSAVTADLRRLIEKLEDDGVLSDTALYPLYLHYAAKADPKQALEIAGANLERALLGRSESCVSDASQSPTLSAVRAYREVTPHLPVHDRATALVELCQKIEAVYPHFSKRATPVLVNGKTQYPQRVEPNPFYAEAQTQCLAALREDGQAQESDAMQAAFGEERAALEKEVNAENESARSHEMPEYIRQHRDGK